MATQSSGSSHRWFVVLVFAVCSFFIYSQFVGGSNVKALSIIGYEPTYGEVRTYTENGNRVIYQQMLWTQDRIDYIQSQSGNVTYEHSFLMNRNAGSKDGPETWALYYPGVDGIPSYISAESNLPSWYVDTAVLADNSQGDTAEFTFGTSNAKALKANVTYWSKMVLPSGNDPDCTNDNTKRCETGQLIADKGYHFAPCGGTLFPPFCIDDDAHSWLHGTEPGGTHWLIPVPGIFGWSTAGSSPPSQPTTAPQPTTQSGSTPTPPPSNPQEPEKKLIVFTDKYYVNAYYELPPGHWDLEDREYRSISIPDGWSYVLVDKYGNQQCFNFSHHNFQDFSEWHVRIDSIMVFDSNVCQPSGEPEREPLGDWFAAFWTDKDYYGLGTFAKFTGQEQYFLLSNLRDGLDTPVNDDIESIDLNENRAVAVFEHDDLRGGVKCFTTSDGNLWDDTFDNGLTVANNISSVRFFTRAECDLRPNAPQDIWLQTVSRDKINLMWVKGSPDTDGYHIYLDEGQGFQRIASISAADARQNAADLGQDTEWARVWTLPNPQCGKSYTFAVSSFSERAESILTRSVTARYECTCDNISMEGVALFDQKYCQGDSVEITDPGKVALADFNERASSIFVSPGWSVEVFENTDNTDGATVCVQDTKWDLNYDRYLLTDGIMEGTVSNVRVWAVPNCGRQLSYVDCNSVNFDGVALFDNTHCLGADLLFSEPGLYNLEGEYNDWASSLYVHDGKSVMVYEDANGQGKYFCAPENKWDLHLDLYWGGSDKPSFNNISSIVVFNDDNCGEVNAPLVVFPSNGYKTTNTVDVTFQWEDVKVNTYWAELWGDNGYFQPSGSLNTNKWSVGKLAPGHYIFKVLADRNSETSTWSKEVSFEVMGSGPTPDTPTPTFTPTQTSTPTSTHTRTPTPTSTFTPTFTPTPTITNTPRPSLPIVTQTVVATRQTSEPVSSVTVTPQPSVTVKPVESPAVIETPEWTESLYIPNLSR